MVGVAGGYPYRLSISESTTQPVERLSVLDEGVAGDYPYRLSLSESTTQPVDRFSELDEGVGGECRVGHLVSSYRNIGNNCQFASDRCASAKEELSSIGHGDRKIKECL